MIRFIMTLLGKEYEPCKSCKMLKEQLEFERANNKELMYTMLSLVQPHRVPVDVPATTEDTQRIPPVAIFSRKRAALEERDRLAAKVQAESKIIAKPDSVMSQSNQETRIEKLETELGLEEGEVKNG